MGESGRVDQGSTALSIIQAALATGELAPSRTLIDATSGNTGIAYAMLGAALGIPVTLVVPESASDERKRTLAAYGANVVYSDPYEGSDGAIRLVREMVANSSDRYYYADQYNNPANTAAHFTSTGPEIWTQTGRNRPILSRLSGRQAPSWEPASTCAVSLPSNSSAFNPLRPFTGSKD